MNMKKFLFALSSIIVLSANAKTRVKVGDLYYDLSGAYASVASSRPVPRDCRGSEASLYTNESYIVPSTITYDGLEYTVTEIGYAAFAGWTSDLYANPMFDSSYAIGSTAKKIVLPPTIKKIDTYAFANCRNLTSIVIPENVTSIQGSTAFLNCDGLREIFYLSQTAPTNWTATSLTYVPLLSAYGNPGTKINDAQIIEMGAFNTTTFTYTGSVPSTEWTNNVAGYEANLDLSSIQFEVGTYSTLLPLTLTKDEETINVNIPFTYTIKAAPLTIKIDNVEREYGEENPTFTYSYEGFINGEDETSLSSLPKITTSASKTSDVGTYTISGSNAASSHYSISYSTGTLSITKAPLSTKIKDAYREYGASNPSFSMEYVGLKNGESTPSWTSSPSYTTTATNSSPVGEYEITATATPKNYELSKITSGILTINAAPLTIQANDVSKTYYSENPELTYTCSGLKYWDDNSVLTIQPTLATNAKKESDAGTYDITIEGASAKNYVIIYKNGHMTVQKRPLYVSVGNYERNYGEDNPQFTIEYEGFVGTDNYKSIDTEPYAYTSATKDTNVGTYTINITGGQDDNYSFYYNSGKLTINKAEQDIIWNQDLTNLAVGEQVQLLAEASSGLSIAYSLDSNEFCEVYTTGKSSYIDCKAEGEIQIRASQEGNGNYYSTPRVSKKIKITSLGSEKPSLTIKQAGLGAISTYVERGSTYQFTITPEDEWVIHSVSFNDKDYSSKLDKSNTFTTPQITKNSTIIIVYSQNPSGIANNKVASFKIIGTKNGIKISGAEIGTDADVYTIDGYLVKTQEIRSINEEIELDNNKVYIIKVGKFTSKVRL